MGGAQRREERVVSGFSLVVERIFFFSISF